MMFSPQYDFTHEQEQVTVYKVQDLEVALQKAMENISQLQANLTFMLKYNEDLKLQHQNQQKKSHRLINELQSQLNKKQKQLLTIKQKYSDYETILIETKSALDNCNSTIHQKQQLIERYQRIIQEQKTTISSLEDEILNSKYNEVSMQSNQTCFLQMEEMEKKIEELEYQNKRLIGNLEKQSKKAIMMEKENNEFKSWLAETVGLRKVVTGCEKVLMDEISKKLRHHAVIM